MGGLCEIALVVSASGALTDDALFGGQRLRFSGDSEE